MRTCAGPAYCGNCIVEAAANANYLIARACNCLAAKRWKRRRGVAGAISLNGVACRCGGAADDGGGMWWLTTGGGAIGADPGLTWRDSDAKPGAAGRMASGCRSVNDPSDEC